MGPFPQKLRGDAELGGRYLVFTRDFMRSFGGEFPEKKLPRGERARKVEQSSPEVCLIF